MACVTAVIEDDTAKPGEAVDGAAGERETLGRDVLGRRLPPLKERLYPPMPRDFEGGWIATLAITAFAAILRFWNLGTPLKFVFDETYYAKDAYSLLKFGYARQFIDKPEGIADKQILAGNLDVFKDTPSLTVHPEVGKWMIAAGEQLFGMNTFGWRFMPALFGTLTVLLVIRTVRRMTRSTLIGCIAGVLLAVDGLHFVMSRVALLDIFLAFWLVAAISCLVADRDWTRRRQAASLDRRAETGRPAARSAAAAVPPVADRGRRLLRARARHQVERGLGDRRLRPARLRLGRRRPPGDRRPARLLEVRVRRRHPRVPQHRAGRRSSPTPRPGPAGCCTTTPTTTTTRRRTRRPA